MRRRNRNDRQRLRACFAALAVLFAVVRASAAEPDEEPVEQEAFGHLRTRAEQVSFDARLNVLELEGNVRIDASPFHLRSPRITLSRVRYGIRVEGAGSLAFCPCLGTPLRLSFASAIVAPPGDLLLEKPTLRFYGVPILPLPYFWLRSDEKPGLLPPEIAYRGADGLYAGGGVHLPWKGSAGRYALDLRGGAYVPRGWRAETRLSTPQSSTQVRFDRVPSEHGSDGLLVDSRGASAIAELTVAWDVDATRGRRGVSSVSDLDAAARPWDRGTFEGVVRAGPFAVSSGMRAIARRGGGLADFDAVGPSTMLRTSFAVGSTLTGDATLEGGLLHVARASGPREAWSYVRVDVGARATALLGPFETSFSLRGVGDATRDARDSSHDTTASARARVELPLVRRFGDVPDPWLSLITPFAEAAVMHATGNGFLGVLASHGVTLAEFVPLSSVGVTTTWGRWGSRDALESSVAVGAAYESSSELGRRVRPLARARLVASTTAFGAAMDGAARVDHEAAGGVVLGRARLGPREGFHFRANVALREGSDPLLARVLADVTLEPGSGFLVQPGTTAGAGLVVPWSRVVTTLAGIDTDVTQRELVAARAGLELRDRCECLTLRVNGSRRIGRDGTDVWLTLDLASHR